MTRNSPETAPGAAASLKPAGDGHGTTTEIRGGWDMAGGSARRERRDTSPAGKWNRGQFETSVKLLRVIGLSPRALEYCRQRGRDTGRLPHEIVVEMFEEALAVEDAVAWRALSPAERKD
jgi:hypothetical protein